MVRETPGYRGKYIPRGCNGDCEAYQAVEAVDMVSIDNATSVARNVVQAVEYGNHDPYDVVCPGDFETERVYRLTDFTNDKKLCGDGR